MIEERPVEGDAFRLALRDYTEAAFRWLAEAPAASLRLHGLLLSPIEEYPDSTTYPDPTGLCAGIVHHRRRAIHEGELHSLPEYAFLVDLVSQDARCQGVLDRTVYSGGRARRIFLSDLTEVPLLNLVQNSMKLEFTDDAFDEEFARLASLLSDQFIEHAGVVPLLGFGAELDEIILDEETSIGVLPPRERALCRKWNYGDRAGGPYWGVRFHRLLAKNVADDGYEPDTGDALQFSRDQHDAVDRVVESLRMLREGGFCAPGLVEASTAGYEDLAGSCTLFYGDRRSDPGGYMLSVEDALKLTEWWRTYRAAMRSPLVSYPLARLSIAGEAQRPEERILNLFICAESLLIKPSEQSTTARLRSRSAALLGTDAASAAVVDDFVRRAARVRGDVVHGKIFADRDATGELSPLTVRRDGSNTGIVGMAEDLADMLRELLGLALDLSMENVRLSDEAARQIKEALT